MNELHHSEGNSSITIPLRKADLGSFIAGLLGQPQTIERDLEVKFDIDHEWLINLHELLDQRIKQQAEADLVRFTVIIYFDNGLRRTLTSVESFKTYIETKKQIPVGVKIVWGYLVQFPNRDFAEHQEITFSAQIHSKERNSENTVKNRFRFESTLFDSVAGESERSSIAYSINHTERTWGDDLEVILSSQIDEVVRGNEIKDALFNLTRLLLCLFILIFCMVYPLFVISEGPSEKIFSLFDQYESLDKTEFLPTDRIEEKIDSIYNINKERIINGGEERAFSMLLMFAGPLIAMFVLRITRKGTSSFMVFSKFSKQNREIKIKKEKRSYYILIFSYLASIACSVIANYGYAWLISTGVS